MDDKKEVLNTKVDDSDIDSLTIHYKNALEEIKNKNFVKANEELDFIYRLNPNSPYYYIAKLLIEFGYSSIDELKEKADDRVVASPYFKKADTFSDEKTKKFLNSLKRQVAVKENLDKLKNAPLDQLLKMFKNQKDSGYDGNFTYSMILKYLDKKYRFVNEEFINDNGKEDTFLNRMNSVENAYRISVAELNKYQEVPEIKTLAEESIKQNEDMKKYLLTFLSLNLDSYIEKGQTEELRNFLQNNYFNNEADALLLKIRSINDNQVSKLKGKHLGLIITTSVIGVSLVALAGGALGYYFLTNSTVINGVKYVKNSSGGYTVSEIDKNYLQERNGVITLESTIAGKDVNILSRDAFYDTTALKEVKNFPNAITSIPNNAFYNCTNLTRVELNTNSKLEVIGDSAFENCTLLTTLTLPNNLKSIGNKSFSHCDAIDNLIIPSSVLSIGDNAFANTEELVNLTNNSQVANTEGKRVGLTLRSITINVGEGGRPISTAPENYYSWDTVYLPKCEAQYYGEFTSYEVEGFKGELSVNETTVSFRPTGLKSINATALYKYKTSVDRQYVTYTLSTDESHYIISSVATTDESGNALTDISLESMIGNKPVSEITRTAFEGNKNVKSISNFPSSITLIPENAFAGCSELTQIGISDDSQLTEIGALAFSGCTKLSSIVIPSKVETIGQNAFLNTPNLLRFTNKSNYKCDGVHLGLEPRTITYTKNGNRVTDTSKLTNYYYVCDEKVTLSLPNDTNRRIASVKVNGSTVGLNSDGLSVTVSTQGNANLVVLFEDEGYYSANSIGVEDGKFGLGFSGSIAVTEQATVTNKYFIGVNRKENASNLQRSDFEITITAKGSQGTNYRVTLDETAGTFTFDAAGSDSILVEGVVKTKITGEIIDGYSMTIKVGN